MFPSEREQRKKLSKVTPTDIEIGREALSMLRAIPASERGSELDFWFVQCVPEMGIK